MAMRRDLGHRLWGLHSLTHTYALTGPLSQLRAQESFPGPGVPGPVVAAAGRL